MSLTDEYIANSRFRVLDVPAAAPGKCAVCGFAGGDSSRKFVDFGLSVDFFGAVYLCTECLKACAVQIGMSTEHSVDEINTLRRFYKEKIAELESFIEGEWIDTYRDLFEQHLSAIRNLVPRRSVLVSDRNSKDSVAGTTGSSESGSTSGGERPAKLSGDTSDGESGLQFGFGSH